MRIRSLGYLGFEGRRYEEWLEFGPQILGLAVGGQGNDGAVHLKMDERKFRLAMHQGPIDRLAYIGWESWRGGHGANGRPRRICA